MKWLLSKPIRYGYMNGIALTVLISQLPKLLDARIESAGPLQDLWSIAWIVIGGKVKWVEFALGAGALVAILLLRSRKRFPGVLAAMIGATAIVHFFNLAKQTGVSVVGALPRGLPVFSIQARAVLRRFDSPDSAEKLEVKSPIFGRVLRVIRDSETPVSGGEPLLEFGDPADLEVAVDVLTTDAAAIRPCARVTIEHWGGPEALDGRARLVEPGAFTKVSALGTEEQRVWVVIDLVSPHDRWATLGDGFRVDAAIVTEEIDDALLVPQSALFHRDGGWAAFVVRGGVAHERRIEPAHRSARMAQWPLASRPEMRWCCSRQAL